MDILWKELTYGMPDMESLAHVIIRLTAAVILGSIIGYERERAGKAAGMRTHILVMLGTCLLVVSTFSMSSDGASRVIQGIITGIGFLGAGTIIKTNDEKYPVRGLTTAAGIWMTAAIGVSIGLGALGIAIIGTVLTLVVLRVLKRLEHKTEPAHISPDK